MYLQAKRQVDELTTLVQVNIVPASIGGTESNRLQYLKQTIEHRKKRWEMFRQHISSRAKAQFTYLLSERSFRGRLLADHHNKLLDLQVRLKTTSTLVTVTDPQRSNRLSPISPKTTAPAAVRELYLAERNLSLRSVCCSRFGKPWALRSVALMNCAYPFVVAVGVLSSC